MKEPTEKQKIERLGEDIAVIYLENKGISIIGRNYLKKYGEIDIIAKKGGILHFIEVKSVTRETSLRDSSSFNAVSRETSKYRAEDNLHPNKLKRLARTIQVYLLEKYQKGDPEWQFDAVILELDIGKRKANVRFLEDIVL